MKVLVTGASGMLGGAVAVALRDRGDSVRVLQRGRSGIARVDEQRGSVTDAAAVGVACRGVDAVVHLAAKVSMSGPEAQFSEVNIRGTELLVSAAAAAGAGRFVVVSSPSVAHAGAAIVGVGAASADPRLARGPYARSKAAAELMALGGRVPAVAVRPHLVWGPGDTQLVARIVGRARQGRLALVGNGAALVDTTYVSNAADAIVAALDALPGVSGRAYVVSNGEPRTLTELVASICDAAGVTTPTRHVPAALAAAAGALVERAWPHVPERLRRRAGFDDEPPMTRFLAEQLSTAHWFDQRETRRALGWAPAVSLAEGFALLRASYAAAPVG